MSFISTINFQRDPARLQGNAQSQSPDSRHQTSPSHDGRGADSPDQPSRTASPDMDVATPGRNPQQLEEYAVTCARRNQLSASAEEGLVDFTWVRSHTPHPFFHPLTIAHSSTKKKSSLTSVRRWLGLNRRWALLKPTRPDHSLTWRSRLSPKQSP